MTMGDEKSMSDILTKLKIEVPEDSETRAGKFFDRHQKTVVTVAKSIFRLCGTLRGHGIVLIHPESSCFADEERHHRSNHRLSGGGLWISMDIFTLAEFVARNNPASVGQVVVESSRCSRDEILVACAMEIEVMFTTAIVNIPPCPCGGKR
jgi:hypothetical protein